MKRIIPREDYPKLVEMYRQGHTLQDIGNKYGVTRERIRQILSRLTNTKIDRINFSKKLQDDFKILKGEILSDTYERMVHELKYQNRLLQQRIGNLKCYYRKRLAALGQIDFDELEVL